MIEQGSSFTHCDGGCGGTADSHSEDDCSLDENDNMVLNAWPGGECSRYCVDWVILHSTTNDILQASSWQTAGQHLGILDDIMPSIYSGVLTIKSEWDKILYEERNNK